jgi:hypothetical protein
MQSPEGTDRSTRRVPRGWLIAAGVFACYLAFRLVQVSVWLVQHI